MEAFMNLKSNQRRKQSSDYDQNEYTSKSQKRLQELNSPTIAKRLKQRKILKTFDE